MERIEKRTIGRFERRSPVPEVVANYLSATALVAIFTAILILLNLDLSAANLSMIYLAVVIVSALFFGRGAAIWASVLSFLCVNWFFVLPRYTFTVRDPGDWISLWMFLVTATVTGQLMAQLRAREAMAREHQKHTELLSSASWAVASQLDTRSALTEVARQISSLIDLKAIAISSAPSEDEPLVTVFPQSTGTPVDEQALGALVTESATSGQESKTPLKTTAGFITTIPLSVEGKRMGVLLLLRQQDYPLGEEQMSLVVSLANHASVILQRHNLFQAEASAKILADANKLKTALLSMVSHDFRSPLTSIKASASTLLEYNDPSNNESSGGETFRELCRGIVQETDRLNRMVGNILDLSRLESHVWVPKLEQTPISELAGMILSGFSKTDNARIDLHLDPELNYVRIDSVQITQVMKNLIENALKYSDGQVEVRMSASGTQFILEVRDRGRGLSHKDEEHMFEPFYRAADLEESAAPGVGIGLSVCKGLVEAHRGNLRAENRPGGGAIFRVTLPVDHIGAP